VNASIVGYGKIGRKRHEVCKELGVNVVAICDISFELDPKNGCWRSVPNLYKNYQTMFNDQESLKFDMVIVSTTNNMLYPIAKLAIENGKHVLVEKPGGINSEELSDLLQLARQNGVYVQVGYNHRYHPAFIEAYDLVHRGRIGDIMYIDAYYGHGGANADPDNWRRDRKISGGGDLIDKGSHLIDLSKWILGDAVFYNTQYHINNYFWDYDVEDNAFLILHSKKEQTAFLHVSCTDWNNTFRFTIFGTDGKIEINGLGGSYGTEKLSLAMRREDKITPSYIEHQYLDGDGSWKKELYDFIMSIKLQQLPKSNLLNALKCMEIIEDVYYREGLIDHN